MRYKDLIIKEFEDNHILDAKYFLTKFLNWDKSTVYRNLERLEKSGEIKTVDNGKNITQYELAKNCSHIHQKCNNCGSIEEMKVDKNTVLKSLGKRPEDDIDITITTPCCKKC